MSKNLTGGFDFAAQLSAAFIERVFQCAYEAGQIPSLVEEDFVFAELAIPGALFLQKPSLRFAQHTGIENAVTLRFPFILRLDSLEDEIKGEIRLLLPVSVVKEKGAGGKPIQTFVIDVQSLAPEDNQVDFQAASQSDKAISEALRKVFIKMMATQVISLPVSPSISAQGVFTSGRLFHNPAFAPSPDEHYSEPDFLGIFLETTGHEKPAPTQYAPLLIHFVPAAHIPQRSKDCVWVIPEDFFMEQLQRSLQKAGMGTFPAPLPGDDSITIESLHFSLQKGSIHVSGRAAKNITSPSSPSVEFSVSLSPAIWNNKLDIAVNPRSMDLPGWAESLHFLSPLMDTILLSVIQQSIENLSGKTVNIPLPGLTFFQEEIALSNTASSQRPVVTVRNEGPLRIREDGILLTSYIDLECDQAVIREPEYIRAHKGSKEFHRKGCAYGDKIKSPNLEVFIREEAALAHGYNGCAFCYPEYDTFSVSNMAVWFEAPQQIPDQHATITVNYEMILLHATGDAGSHAEQQRSITRTSWVGRDGIYSQAETFRNLVPGEWLIKVSSGKWSASCKRKTHNGRTRRCKFVLEQDGCVVLK